MQVKTSADQACLINAASVMDGETVMPPSAASPTLLLRVP
jgi:hypothetical protein